MPSRAACTTISVAEAAARIPEKLGGLGATLLERVKAQERLAQGCGATALAINMHFNTLGLLIDLHRKFKWPNVEEKLRRIGATRCTHFIDDLPELLAEPAFPREAFRILFDPMDSCEAPSGVGRVRSWKEIEEKLLAA